MLVLVGIFLGLLSATISESFFHKFFGHPFEKVKNLYFKNTALFSACLKPYYQHFVIHHKKTYLKNFFNQFDSLEHKEKVDTWIKHNFDKNFQKLIKIERYNLTLKGFVGTLPFAGPFCIGPILIYSFLGLGPFLGSLLTAYIPVWMSKYIHPLIHAPEETRNHSLFIQWLMKTKYMEKVLLNHYLHHNDGDNNFNLLLGGDYLIGLHRKAEKHEMREFAILLKDFRSKVRAQSTKKALSPSLNKENISERDILIQKYCLFQNPTTRQRYEFQKEVFELNQKIDNGHWDYESFGFDLYSKVVDFRKWAKRVEFSLNGYDNIGETIHYRGHSFNAGDVLLTNQNSDADGLFSTLLERDINFSHAAVFINLEYNSQLYPAVIEINEYGTRAVPLKVFLSKEFNSYIEIFRLSKNINKLNSKVLGRAGREFLEEVHAFDIYQNRQQNHYVNCARTVELIYKKVGVELEIGDSKYHRSTNTNLHTLGIEESIDKDLLMPDDYALNSKFNIVGCICNSNMENMLPRNLVRFHFQNIWRTKTLSKEKFPIGEKLKYHFIKIIQENNVISKVILLFLGFDYKEFPSGPATFISLVSFGDNQMISAVEIIRQELQKNWNFLYRNLNWDELISHPQMVASLEASTKGFSEIFEIDSHILRNRMMNDELMESPNAI